ncbi:unnamed protein product [Peniophora sp. CBMAI 1063]|nr:unnamed protein product [Peniophora sp. CBMAI 1063]
MTTPGFVSKERLLEIGEDFAATVNGRIFPVFVETILYTLYSVLIVIHFIKHRNNPRHAPGIFALSVWLYLLCTACWALDFSMMCTDLYRYLPETLSSDATMASDNEEVVNLNSTRIFVHDIFAGTVFVFCDVIALWRAYVIYGRPRWLAICSTCLFSLSLVLYALVGIFDITQNLRDAPAFVLDVHSTVIAALAFSALSTTMVAHCASTALIARKAWVHRRRLRCLINARVGNSKDYKPMIVLSTVIESASTAINEDYFGWSRSRACTPL